MDELRLLRETGRQGRAIARAHYPHVDASRDRRSEPRHQDRERSVPVGNLIRLAREAESRNASAS